MRIITLLIVALVGMLPACADAGPFSPVIWASPYPKILAKGIMVNGSDTTTTCNAAAAGSIRYNAGTFEGCNGSAWYSMNAGSAANTSLSNLANPTAINRDFVFSTGSGATVKTADNSASTTKSITIQSGYAAALGTETNNSGHVIVKSGETWDGTSGSVYVSAGVPENNGSRGSVFLDGATIFLHGDAGSTAMAEFQRDATTGNVTYQVNTNGGTDNNLVLATEDNGAGDSGNIVQQTGTASGTRGGIYFLDGTEGTSGECWVSTGTGGEGNWDTCPGGGAALSDLTAADATNTLANANYAQVWNWATLTTETALKLSSSSLTTGKILHVENTNGSGNHTNGVLNVSSNSTQSNAVVMQLDHSGASGTHYGLKINTTGAGGGASLYINNSSTTATGYAAIIDNNTTSSSSTVLLVRGNNASNAGNGIWVNKAGTSGYVGKFQSGGTGGAVRDIIQVFNGATATNGTVGAIEFNLQRTTGGDTAAAKVGGGLSDVTNGAYKGFAAFYTADNAAPAERMRIDYAGHVEFSGTAPALSSCGTTPSIVGTDNAGTITAGSSATGCTVTFNKAWTNAPSCIILDQSQGTLPEYSVSTTALTISTGLAGGEVIHYQCVGYR